MYMYSINEYIGNKLVSAGGGSSTNNEVDLSDVFLRMDWQSGINKITVSVRSVAKGDKYQGSDIVESVDTPYDRFGTKKLKAPENLKWKNSTTATWDQVAGATGYRIKRGNMIWEVSTAEYQLGDSLLNPEIYGLDDDAAFKVQAFNEEGSSSWSTTLDNCPYYKLDELEAPENVHWSEDGKKASWDDVEGAKEYSYQLKVYYKNGAESGGGSKTRDTSIDFTNELRDLDWETGIRKVTIIVRAIADVEKNQSSEITESEETPYGRLYHYRTVSGIGLDVHKKSLNVGRGFVLHSTVLPADATNDSIIWTSSDPDIASVSQMGRVHGKSQGQVVITATSEDGGYQDCCEVQIIQTDNIITVTGHVLSLTVDNASGDVRWHAQDEEFVSFEDANGPKCKFRADVVGNTRIYATLHGNTLASFNLTIQQGLDKAKLVPSVLSEENIPSGIRKAGYTTPGEIENAMRIFLTGESDNRGKFQLFDLKLQVTSNGETWHECTEKDFPEEGINILFPYPDGSKKDGFRFRIAHMVSTSCNGFSAGDIENPRFKKTNEGLVVTLKGLSPIMVYWEEDAGLVEAAESETTIEARTMYGADETGFSVVQDETTAYISHDELVARLRLPGESNESAEERLSLADTEPVVVFNVRDIEVKNLNCRNEIQGPNFIRVVKAFMGKGYEMACTYRLEPTNGNITHAVVTMRIPLKFQKTGRTFEMIQVSRNGIPRVLKDEDDNPTSITLDTDAFGAFALAYKD